MLRSCRIRSRRAAGSVAGPVAEEPLEEGARIAFHRQRRGRRAPAQRADVGATEAGVAGATELRQPDAHLERRELRLAAQLGRRDLVDGAARLEVGALRRLGVHAGQEGAGDAPVAAGGIARHLGGRRVVEPGQDQQPLPEGGEGLEDRRELEAGPLRLRRPVAHDGAVRHVDHPQAGPRPGRGAAHRRQRRHHPVEQRQRDRRPQPAQHRAPGQRLPGDDHDSALLI